jgi:hypothetical protein
MTRSLICINPNVINLKSSQRTTDIGLFFVSFVLFVVSLPFQNKLQIHHEEHEDHEGEA